jgi:hypothetical protein
MAIILPFLAVFDAIPALNVGLTACGQRYGQKRTPGWAFVFYYQETEYFCMTNK